MYLIECQKHFIVEKPSYIFTVMLSILCNAHDLTLTCVLGWHTDCKPVQTFTHVIVFKLTPTPDKPANFASLFSFFFFFSYLHECARMCVYLFVFCFSFDEEDNLWREWDGLFVLSR